MACIRPDGTLTETGRAVLAALAKGSDEEGAAKETGLPLYRARMVVRALGEAGLVTAAGTVDDAADGATAYKLTAAGRDKLGGGR